MCGTNHEPHQYTVKRNAFGPKGKGAKGVPTAFAGEMLRVCNKAGPALTLGQRVWVLMGYGAMNAACHTQGILSMSLTLTRRGVGSSSAHSPLGAHQSRFSSSAVGPASSASSAAASPVQFASKGPSWLSRFLSSWISRMMFPKTKTDTDRTYAL